MEKVVPPKYVRQTLVALRARGHLAYLVGGCVRDMLLGVRPNDWDICTSALPEQVMEVFPHSRPTGLKHGTVTVIINSRSLEVTTFRTESGYADHRHPDAVRFVGDLRSDLSRRDFTINAMALSPEGVLMDPFGGAKDLRQKLIRCVGAAEQRFEEDALRMFRALRFAARLGFSIEEETLRAIDRKAPLAAELAAERVQTEVEKLLLSPAPESVHLLMSLGLMERYAKPPLGGEASFAPLALLPRKALERWAGLSFILLRQGCIPSAEAFLSGLKLDNRTIRCCSAAEEILKRPMPADTVEWKRLLRRHGVDAVSCAAACADAVFGLRCRAALKAVLKSGDCFSLRHMALGGEELLALGLQGRELGDMLDFLLDHVLEHPGDNRPETLLALAEEKLEEKNGHMGKAEV